MVQGTKLSDEIRSSLSFSKIICVCYEWLNLYVNGFKWYSKKADMLSVKNSLFKIAGLPGTLCSRFWILANK